MNEYLVKKESLTAIANEIRTLTGTTESMSLTDMATNVGNANSEVANQAGLITQIQTALQNKASGVALPTLSNPASASDMLSGKEAINASGQKITGTIATKTSSNLTASGATVTVPAGYYASQATKSVSTATQATPSVSVSSSGLITASATQTAGYVSAGTKSGTKQLTTQAAKTVTPSTSSQTAVASGVYTTGAVTVAAIPSKYEDVGAETNAYTAKIASLETAVTALETELAGKASGGGSGSVGTCIVSISGSIMIIRYGATRYIDGVIVCEAGYGYGEQSVTIDNVVKGSCFTAVMRGDVDSITTTNCTMVLSVFDDISGLTVAFYEVTR